NPVLADPKGKRDDPKVFPAEDPRVAAGNSVLALKGEGSDTALPTRGGANSSATHGFRPNKTSKLKSHPWVVVTALAPSLKEEEEYAQLFDRAGGLNKDRDFPQY